MKKLIKNNYIPTESPLVYKVGERYALHTNMLFSEKYSIIASCVKAGSRYIHFEDSHGRTSFSVSVPCNRKLRSYIRSVQL